jgi:hypothetical protein
VIINLRLINDYQFQINMTHIQSVVMEDINKEEEEEELDIKNFVISSSEEDQLSRSRWFLNIQCIAQFMIRFGVEKGSKICQL